MTSGGERGLLALAFAPDYATSHHFYVYYTGVPPVTAHTGDIEVDQFTATSPDHADPASRVRILTIPTTCRETTTAASSSSVPTGCCTFDRRRRGRRRSQGNGQNLTATNPDANQSPLLGQDAADRAAGDRRLRDPRRQPVRAPAGPVWMLGLRNPFRYSFDRETGDMIIGDVGQEPLRGDRLRPGAEPRGRRRARRQLRLEPARGAAPVLAVGRDAGAELRD